MIRTADHCLPNQPLFPLPSFQLFIKLEHRTFHLFAVILEGVKDTYHKQGLSRLIASFKLIDKCSATFIIAITRQFAITKIQLNGGHKPQPVLVANQKCDWCQFH